MHLLAYSSPLKNKDGIASMIWQDETLFMLL